MSNLSNVTVNKLINEQVIRTPANIAIVFNGDTLTYKDMNDQAEFLAGIIKKRMSAYNDTIGILLNRSSTMVVCIIAVLKAGGCFVPIDPDFPEERIRYMIQDSNISLLISSEPLIEKIKTSISVINIDAIKHDDVTFNPVLNDSLPHYLAYIIYTSGSTGRPKGVMIEHKSLTNFIKGTTDLICFLPGMKIIALTTISFDIFILETILPLTKGLTVYVADEETQKNPKLLTDYILRNKIDILQITPSRIQLIYNYDKNLIMLKNLKVLMIGGEQIFQNFYEQVRTKTSARIYNMYGPTETTIWSTISDLTLKKSIDIGKPIINTQVYFLDNEGFINSNEGEICIGGAGVARGYINKEKLTEEKFITIPAIADKKLYKTGDMGRLLPSGDIEFIGRMDNQVKIRGYRIEPSEIETALLRYEPINQVAVNAYDGKDGIKYLCAYYTSDSDLSKFDLIEHLRSIIAEYMVPSYFIRLDKIPLTANGKLDRKALPKPEKKPEEDNCGIDIETYTIKERLKKIIINNLDMSIPFEKSFSEQSLDELGINSIIFVSIIVSIETEFGFEFDDGDLNLTKFPDINTLLNYVSSKVKVEK